MMVLNVGKYVVDQHPPVKNNKISAEPETENEPESVSEITQKPCAELWGQCGGIGWSGSNCCQGNSKCIKKSTSYYQCVPEFN